MSGRRPRLFRLPWRSRRQIRDDVNEELAFHLDTRVDALIAAGYDADSARERALREFGDIDDARRYIDALDTAKEAATRRSDIMSDLLHDLRYAARSMGSAPGFAAAVIATLALGIGATTAIFSIVNGVLLRPLPFPEPDRIVRLFQINAKDGRESVSQANFRDWQAQTHSFSAVALWGGGFGSSTVQTPGGPVTARISSVTQDFFAVLGVHPEIGRPFSAEETRFGGPRAVIISDAFWRAQFGASPAVLGQRISQGKDSYEIVGVMPSSAAYPPANELWVPIELFPPNLGRTSQGYRVIARLKPGVSLPAAQQDLSAVSRRLKQEYGNETSMSDAVLVGLREDMVGNTRPRLLMLLAASAFLLVIGLANAVNLLMARLALRQSELAVRVALGATAWRLTRQVLAESAVLVSLAAVAGVVIAAAAVRLVLDATASVLPRAAEVRVDWSVLAFTIAISIVLSMALGVMAAWRGARRDVRDALSASPRAVSGAASSTRLRRAMVVMELSLTVMLLIGAALFGHSFVRLLDVSPGFSTEHVVVVDAQPAVDDKLVRLDYYNTLIERVRSLPGVVAVGSSNGVPIVGGGADGTYLLLDNPTPPATYDWSPYPASQKGHAEFRIVDGDYFAAMGINLLHGRVFARTDGPDAQHVGVVSAKFAAQTWRGESPIGKIVEYGNMDSDLRPFRVVGVVGDVRDDGLAADPPPIFYGYLPQRPAAYGQTLVVRTSGDPTTVIASTRRIVHDLRPDVPVRTSTIDRVIADSVADRRFTLLVVAAFAGAALLLAIVGVYSVVSYLVTQRTREIGVRVALGAQHGHVLRLIVGEGLRLAATGLVLGVIGSLLLTRMLRGLVYGVSPTDPVAFASVLALLVVVAVVAAYVPARRATRVDPMQVLRSA